MIKIFVSTSIYTFGKIPISNGCLFSLVLSPLISSLHDLVPLVSWGKKSGCMELSQLGQVC
jgi:hypothetical protein